MERVAIIGAGVSGLTAAHFLKEKYDVTIFEKEDCPGGLIRCSRINGNLFHTCGGHVFNSKRQDVLDWFWSKFRREDEFIKTDRNSCVIMDNDDKSSGIIPYPIENHVYYFTDEVQKKVYDDLNEIDAVKGPDAKFSDYESFGDFLRWRFGNTLYNMYFKPYNEKVWRRDLSAIPMSWMDGKLPMPTTKEMRDSNANHTEEKSFVHSSFWYEKINGSQYVADKLATGLNVKYNREVRSLKKTEGKWIVCEEQFDKIVFCGNIKDLVKIVEGVDVCEYVNPIENLEYHGTTAVFCEIDKTPYSWIYQPSRKHKSHRIICTGNFSPTNNMNLQEGRITATIEFTDEISKEDILKNLECIPLNPTYISHKYNRFTYPIQGADTRPLIQELKDKLSVEGLYFTGRFADWEYYNMDVAMGAAMDLCKKMTNA